VIQNFDDAIEEGKQVDSYIQRIDKDSDEYKSVGRDLFY
jgi:chaperonin cofactor prefoldin